MNRAARFGSPNRWLFRGVSLIIGTGLVLAVGYALPPESRLGILYFGRNLSVFPFTIQNLEHLILFLGLGELCARWLVANRELGMLQRGFLPEDSKTILQSHDLAPIRQSVVREYDGTHGFLPNLIDLCILQFQSSRSVELTASVLKNALDLISQRVELRYTLSRYLVWLLPTVGFIGTVVGIAGTLGIMENPDPDLRDLAGTLSVAFDTTIVALIESGILVLLLHVVQEREERSVNLSGDYTLRNLVNRLYAAGS